MHAHRAFDAVPPQLPREIFRRDLADRHRARRVADVDDTIAGAPQRARHSRHDERRHRDAVQQHDSFARVWCGGGGRAHGHAPSHNQQYQPGERSHPPLDRRSGRWCQRGVPGWVADPAVERAVVFAAGSAPPALPMHFCSEKSRDPKLNLMGFDSAHRGERAPGDRGDNQCAAGDGEQARLLTDEEQHPDRI